MIPPFHQALQAPDSFAVIDAIIGRMVRDLIKFEGEVNNTRTRMAIQSVIDHAEYEARQFGADPSLVSKVAAHFQIMEGPVL